MTAQYSARYNLPLLVTAQAQKEITHNEALVSIDALLHPVVQNMATVPPIVTAEDEGKCWLIANAATDAWVGHDGEMACWTGGSWRFMSLPHGSRIFDISSQSDWRFTISGWVSAPEIAVPTGGATVDSEVREVIELLMEHLRSIGVLAGGA